MVIFKLKQFVFWFSAIKENIFTKWEIKVSHFELRKNYLFYSFNKNFIQSFG